jgi:hypothetical protein
MELLKKSLRANDQLDWVVYLQAQPLYLITFSLSFPALCSEDRKSETLS